MNHEEHDDLWRLLGKLKEPTVSPFFSRNVLRAIRREEKQGVIWVWLRRQWRLAAIGAFALLIASVGTWQNLQQRHQISELAQEVSASPDYTVIAHLDELLAYEENSVWLDNPGY